MASVSSVDSLYLSDYVSATRTPKTVLGKDDFLKLLITQMQYQDPLNPIDNTEYIAQMAQFSALEQMTNMANSFDTMQAFSLIGKTVTAKVDGTLSGTTEVISGKVEKVIKEGSNIYLVVKGTQITPDDVCEVTEDDG